MTAPDPFASLPVEGFEDAVVSLPLGTTRKRPVVIASHGNYDRPEWQCQVWREIVAVRAFVLCPRGRSRPDSPTPDDIRFTYDQNQKLEKEILAGLQALAARYPDFVDVEGAVIGGFSLGAIMGVAIASRNPAAFPRAALVEGGYDKWTPAAIRAYAEGGGKRVLFACGQPGCAVAARQTSQALEKAGIATQVVAQKSAGHDYGGAVAEDVKGALDWLVEGDPRWSDSPGPPL